MSLCIGGTDQPDLLSTTLQRIKLGAAEIQATFLHWWFVVDKLALISFKFGI